MDIEAEINSHLGALKDNPIVKLLNEQRQLMKSEITVNDITYRTKYYYQIHSEYGDVWRRYSDFELLSEYLFKQHPQIIQKVLPPKENIVQFLTSFVYENQQILQQRQHKFQIYLNDIKNQFTKEDEIWINFLKNTQEFSDYMMKVDQEIVKNQKYITRIKSFGLQFWYSNQQQDAQLSQQHQQLQARIQQMQQIVAHLELLALNLEINQKQPQIVMDNKQIEVEINKIIQSMDLYSQEYNIFKGLATKCDEIIELFANIRMDAIQLQKMDNLISQQIEMILLTLKQIQK